MQNKVSALVLAARKRHFELVKILLEAGADPNQQMQVYICIQGIIH